MGHGRGPREAALSRARRDDAEGRRFDEVVRARRMTRSFLSTPIDRAVVDHLLDRARRAPSAGNTSSTQFLVLDTPDAVAAYWDTTLAVERRASFAWPGLLQAPVLVVPWVDPDAYVARYAESDKAHTGLGDAAAAWPVPYWFVDGGAVVMSILLGAEAEGLGALLFGLFEHEAAVRRRFGVPEQLRAVGAVALGHGAPDERASGSTRRPRRPLDEIVHRGTW